MLVVSMNGCITVRTPLRVVNGLAILNCSCLCKMDMFLIVQKGTKIEEGTGWTRGGMDCMAIAWFF